MKVPGLRKDDEKVGGIVYFGRMLDKIRLQAQGKLLADYKKNLGIGFDGRCVRFLYVDYQKLVKRVAGGGTDEEMLGWCYQKVRKPTDEEIEVWNGFLSKRGWRDNGTENLEKEKKRGDGPIETISRPILISIVLMKKINLFVFSFLFLFAGLAQAREIACPAHFASGDAPEVTNPKLQQKSQVLCYEEYAVLHSGLSKTPLWSAEYLTQERIQNAKGLKRKNAFHPEEQLPAEDRSELHDYIRSGFDRGHMSPSGDMSTEKAQYESFSLANIIPQDRNNNEVLWEGIESSTRTLAKNRKEIFVITGPIFAASEVKRINSRVFIPSHVFKAIYVPARQEAGAYITPNAPGMKYETVSIAELEKRIGINLFPKMPVKVKETKMDLPEPTPHGSKRGRGRHQKLSDNETFSGMIHYIFH